MNTTQTPKLNKATATLWTARLGEFSANVSRIARGEYRVTYFNAEGIVIDTEPMRDSLTNVAERLGDWLTMMTR